MKNRSFLFLFFGCWSILVVSCIKPDNVYSAGNAVLKFSHDTLLFDTVFTTIGSTTENFKLYNPYNAPLNISKIQLQGGTESQYRINVDGMSGVSFTNVEVPPGDSLYVFVEVTVDPVLQNEPKIVEDFVLFTTNGNQQRVTLAAYGQDAHFHVNELVEGTWSNDKPHVIYGIAAVGFPGLDSNKTLTVEAGTRIHVHKNSGLYVYKSTLNVEGEHEQKVSFSGDRLEDFYDDVSGQWGIVINNFRAGGIWLVQSNNSIIDNAVIKNGDIGIRVDTLFQANTPALTLRNTEISNMGIAGLYTVAGATVLAENCLFGNSGSYAALLAYGGFFEFKNCTFANYWSGSRSTASVALNNYFEVDNTAYIRTLQAQFYNCILYGSNETELEIDTAGFAASGSQFNFNTCILKHEEPLDAELHYTSCMVNQDPLFINPYESDFNIQASSPAKGTANTAFSTSHDIEGTLRDVGAPSIGAYEGN